MTASTHSPLGASGAYRWIECPGSPAMSEGVPDEESDFAIEGTAGHSLGEVCLGRHDEPWMFIGGAYDPEMRVVLREQDLEEQGQEPTDVPITKNMADAVQYYVSKLEEWHPRSDRNQGNAFIEYSFACPNLHKFFYGTSDFVFISFNHQGVPVEIDIWDYKHGAGIVVEAKDNPQGMYYTCGVLEKLQLWKTVKKARIHIVQPRGWHKDGPHRYWEVSTEDLRYWLIGKCLPAMERATISRETFAGEHCRFCPARSRQCPALMKVLAEWEKLVLMVDEKGAKALTPAQVGRLIALDEIAKIARKAAYKTAQGYLQAGRDVPGVKLVPAKVNRDWKKGAEAAAKKQFGSKCTTKPAFMSPAQLEGLPGGKEFTARWAYKPKGLTTVALNGDPREQIHRDNKSLFSPLKRK